MNFYYIKKSDNLSNVIMDQESYRNLTLSMSTGDYCAHEVSSFDSLDDCIDADYISVDASGDISVIQYSNQRCNDDFASRISNIKKNLKLIDELMTELKSEPNPSQKSKDKLRLVHSAEMTGLDQIKLNMRSFDRQRAKVEKDRRLNNNKCIQRERLK